MINKKSWDDLSNTGLLWFINSFLHLFGWAIIIERNHGKITDVYPARVKFRGFDEMSTKIGYQKVSQYMANNAEELLKETIHSK